MGKKDLSEAVAWGIVKAVLFCIAVALIIAMVVQTVHAGS